MKKTNKNVDEKSTKKELRKKKTERKGTHNRCKWYDWSAERDFFRKVGSRNEKGERTKILERRAICRCGRAKAFRRLVMGDKATSCSDWEEGKYISKKIPEKSEDKTSPKEYFGVPDERLKEQSKRETQLIPHKNLKN